MRLDFIAIDKLFVDPANMRRSKKPPDVSDLLPSIARRGVLQSLIVRRGDGGRFGIVAGSRRFRAASLLAGQHRTGGDGHAEPVLLPCAILEDGDDAAALEISLIENVARLDPDEVTRWESSVRLVKQGRSVEEIADTFALPALAVRRTLALGNLLPRIRDLYRHARIDGATVRQLTLASIARQKDWLRLWDDPDNRAPLGWQLKGWLFGGTTISAGHALFDVAASGLVVVADLFGEESYVADPEAFWRAQHAEIDARKAAYLAAGWGEVVIVPPTEHFQPWEYEKAARRKGGRVYVDVRATGEVVFHQGYVGRKEAARTRTGEGQAAEPPRAARPEISGPMQVYVDLHRHAAVRAALLRRPEVALRLMVAHAIVGSHLFRVSPEPQEARSDAVRESVKTSRGETVFDAQRRTVLGVLGFDPECPTVVDGRFAGGDAGDRLSALFQRLLDVPDAALLEVIAVVIGEALASGSTAVEAVGRLLDLDMAQWWQPDPAFFDLIRDREVLGALVAEVAGETVAAANAKETGKTRERIVADHLAGADGRSKFENWVPRWMAFPPAAYTARGGVGTVRAFARLGTDTPPPASGAAESGVAAPDAPGVGEPGIDAPQVLAA
jgi:ParB family chromosome partitioning protein